MERAGHRGSGLAEPAVLGALEPPVLPRSSLCLGGRRAFSPVRFVFRDYRLAHSGSDRTQIS